MLRGKRLITRIESKVSTVTVDAAGKFRRAGGGFECNRIRA
jgi:hypothetical protein